MWAFTSSSLDWIVIMSMRRAAPNYAGLLIVFMKTVVMILSAVSAILLAGFIMVAAVFLFSYIPGAEKTDLYAPKPGETLGAGNTTGLPLKLPSGFFISIFAEDLKNPRVMVSDPRGNILTSITSEGKVVALPDKNQDGVVDSHVTVLEDLDQPHGLAFKCDGDLCLLFVAETNRVMAYDYDSKNVRASNARKLADLPGGGGHLTRTLMFLPGSDSELLVSVGSFCNVCNESDWRRAKILKVNITNGRVEEYASGLRNSVFMTASLKGEVWATEMGRDLLGDELPPDEVNIIEGGKNYGWPICYGKNIHDTKFDKNNYIRDPCSDTTPSLIDIQAHSAPLGLAFIPKGGWPDGYGDSLLVAYHGSWNRSIPTGYKIVRYMFEDGKYKGEEDFISGWLSDNEKIIGRPAGLLVQPASSPFITNLFISDDKRGVIYRVAYKEGQAWRFFEKSKKGSESIKSVNSVLESNHE